MSADHRSGTAKEPLLIKQYANRKPAGFGNGPGGTIVLRANYALVKIKVSDIVYVEALDDYIRIHFTNRPSAIYRFTLKSMMKLLPANEFGRIHRSYIIALTRVTAVRRKAVYIDEIEIPVGISYEEAFFASFLGGGAINNQ